MALFLSIHERFYINLEKNESFYLEAYNKIPLKFSHIMGYNS